MDNGVVETHIIESDQSSTTIGNRTEEYANITTVIAKITDLKTPAQRRICVLHGQRKDVGISFNVIDVVVHYDYLERWPYSLRLYVHPMWTLVTGSFPDWHSIRFRAED